MVPGTGTVSSFCVNVNIYFMLPNEILCSINEIYSYVFLNKAKYHKI